MNLAKGFTGIYSLKAVIRTSPVLGKEPDQLSFPNKSLKPLTRISTAIHCAAANVQSPDAKEILRCDNIVVSPRGIAETSGKKIVIFVPAAEIDRIMVKHGRSDHRPGLSLFIGIVFMLVGAYGLMELMLAPRGYRYELGMIAFGIIGGSLIYDALKQRYFLEVHGKKGTRRLVFSKDAQNGEISEFCNGVRTIYKYDITDDIRVVKG